LQCSLNPLALTSLHTRNMPVYSQSQQKTLLLIFHYHTKQVFGGYRWIVGALFINATHLDQFLVYTAMQHNSTQILYQLETCQSSSNISCSHPPNDYPLNYSSQWNVHNDLIFLHFLVFNFAAHTRQIGGQDLQCSLLE